MTGRDERPEPDSGFAGRRPPVANPPTGRPSTGGPPAVRLRRLPLPVLLGALLLAGLCTPLALNTASAAQELKQRALTDSNASTSDLEQQLVRDLAAKQAPAALASQALAQGLVPNPNPAFLRINANGSVTVLGSPTPASIAPPPVSATPSRTPSATPSGSKKPSPGASHSTAGSSKASAAPIVTVTVTRSAPSSTPSPTPHPHTSSTAPGGH